MIETIQNLEGKLGTVQSLIGEIGFGVRTLQVIDHYLDKTDLVIVFEDNSKIRIDISEYLDENGELDELTVSKIEELIVSYFENKTIEEVEK